jgi:4-amino-4-deoxy-L-arabinose transferase-like glycosyltransferase
LREPRPQAELDEARAALPDERPVVSSDVRAVIAVALIVLAFAASALPAMPGQALSKASQARAWHVAKTMAETGDLVIPRYHGETRLKKPPLQSWAQAATMKAVGSTELWAAGLGTWIVGLLFALGPWLLGRAIGRADAGLLGSLLLCASRAAITWGASPEHDVPFAGWIALSWAFLARALSERGRLRDVVVAGLASGAALMTKAPFVLAFVPGTALLLRRQPETRGPVRGLPFWTVLLAGALLPGLFWLEAIHARLGSVAAVFDEMHRQALGSGGAHTKPFPAWIVYYVGVVAKTLLPWSPIVLGAIAVLLVRRHRGDAGLPSPWLRFPVVAFLVGFATLTVIPAKQEHYVLPILVPAALLAGQALVTLGSSVPRFRWLLPSALLLAALGYAATRWISARSHFAWETLDPWTWPRLAGLLVAGLALARRRALVVAGLLASVAMGAAGLFDGARDRATEDYRESVAQAEDVFRDGVPVVGFAAGAGEAFDTAVAWIESPFERVRSREDLRTRLGRGGRVAVLVRSSETSDLGDLEPRLVRRSVLAPPVTKSDRDRLVLYTPSDR